MMWTAPAVPQLDECLVGAERPMLDRWLVVQRASFLERLAGLNGEDLARPVLEPSPLSLLGLLRHLTDVERAWFRRRLAGQDLPMACPGKDACFLDADPAGAERDYTAFLAEQDDVTSVLAEAELTDTYQHDTYGTISLRWMYIHVLREYAGHIGHADLLREQIDGTTFS